MTSFATHRFSVPRILSLCAILLAIGGGTSAAQIAVRSSLAHDHHVAPGTTHRGTIEIENLTDEPRQARLQLRDYRFSHRGTNQFGDPGTLARSNASWIDVPSSIVTLAPRQRKTVEYTVEVPAHIDGSSPAGTYWSVLLVEPMAPDAPSSTLPASENAPSFGVRQVTRYGVQIATHIRGAGAPHLEVLDTDLARRDSTSQLTLDVKNTGTQMARPTVRLEVYDTNGSVALHESSSPMRVYPGTSVRYRLPLSELTSGRYEAVVLVDAEGRQVTGFQHTLKL